MEKAKKKKLTSSIIAVALCVLLLLTGTFAWQSISQTALNEAAGAVNPGGRLHDDFNGTNKDVYVENYTKPGEGVPIFARVRLDEYMEIGDGAGLKTGDAGHESKAATSVVGGANINDVSTWKTHIPGAGDDTFHEYFEWDMGGSTIYMPTFNMNADSLKADINGTYEGTTPDDDIHYDDYHAYTLNETKIDDEVYDIDEDTEDEAQPVEDTDIDTVADQTHTAKNTLTSQVMTMEEWIEAGSNPGAYWVYDTDGWAYWAQAIEPGTATGLLLDGISQIKDTGDDWYYGINVVGQFATMGDWGSADDNDGFFGPTAGEAPTDNALFLLNQAAGRDLTVTVTANGSADTVKAGETLDFDAEVKMGDADHGNQKVTWTVQGNKSNSTRLNADGLLTVAADEYIGGKLTVQALSTVDNTTKGTYTVKVTSPWDTSGIGDITPQTLQTATLDGIDWYVLARDGNKALLLSKDIQEERRFDEYPGGDNEWQDSEMRTYLNGTWLSGKSTIKNHVSETTLNTRKEFNSDEFFTTQDKVFLLSEADVFGKINTNISTSEKVAVAKDYTLGKVGVIVPENMRIAHNNGPADWWWLRSPRSGTNYVAGVYSGGNATSGTYDGTGIGVRPALWINLGS